MKIFFVVRGEPYGKGRPRFARQENKLGKQYVKTYTPQKTSDYEELVQTEFMSQVKKIKPFGQRELLEMTVYAYYEIPKTTPKWQIPYMLKGIIRPLKKPDWDNIGKTVADSLNGVAYHDDQQIVDGMVRKFYSDKPRVEVTIRTIKGYPQMIKRTDLEKLLGIVKEKVKTAIKPNKRKKE